MSGALAGAAPLDMALAVAGGYLLGSIPFGLVLTRLAGYGDIRQIGSGNIGATNVLRTGNRPLALATLLLDGGKGGIAVAAGLLAGGGFAVAAVAGLAAVIGHNFPVWLGFRGGKGVATTIGTLLVAAWPVGLLVCATWLAVAGLFRFSSLAAIVSLALSPVYAWFFLDAPDNGTLAMIAAVLAVLCAARHRANIGRLMRGEEPKIGKKD